MTGDGGLGTEDRMRRAAAIGDGVEIYKFQRLDVYRLALEYADMLYRVGSLLPESERFNLRSQMERAVTSIALNIAEGSTGLSNAEQQRFLSMAERSYMETVACLDLIERRGYRRAEDLVDARKTGHCVFVKLQAFRTSLA